MVQRNRVTTDRDRLAGINFQAGKAYVITLTGSWIAVRARKPDGSPADGVACRITTADGRVVERQLDADGRTRVSFPDSGTCRVAFPDQDAGCVCVDGGEPQDRAPQAEAAAPPPQPAPRELPDDHWACKLMRDGVSFEERWRAARERRGAPVETETAPATGNDAAPAEPAAEGASDTEARDFACASGREHRFVVAPPGALVIVSAGPRQRFAAADRFILRGPGYEAATRWDAGSQSVGGGRLLRFSPPPSEGTTLELSVEPSTPGHAPYVIAGRVVPGGARS